MMKDLRQKLSLVCENFSWIVFYRVILEQMEKWVYLDQLVSQGLLDSQACLVRVKMENK